MGRGLSVARRLSALILPGPGGLFVRLTEAALRAYYGKDYSRGVFRAIYAINGWGSPETVSGPGSTLANTEAVRRELPGLLARIGAASLLDAPCGDGHWIASVDLGRVAYTGVDVVRALVEGAKGPRGDGPRRFLLADIRMDELPEADVILCRDALVHLSNEDAIAAVANFRRSGARYVLMTTFPELAANTDIRTGRWRPMNLELPPFVFPPPVALVVESESDSGGPKALGLWRL